MTAFLPLLKNKFLVIQINDTAQPDERAYKSTLRGESAVHPGTGEAQRSSTLRSSTLK